MIKLLRFSPSRLALGYIGLSVLALVLLAVPLWYAWRTNIATFKAYVEGENVQELVDVFDREGAQGLAAAIESRLGNLPADEILILADASKRRLGGNLPAWPVEVPDGPGTYGLVIGLGGGASKRVVASHVTLPGGYHLLVGRDSVRFQSLVELFWYGIAGAVAVVLALGAGIGWSVHRALLAKVQEISRAASAIVAGDLSRRLTASSGSPELDTLARTVNDMLGQLATQNERLANEVGVRGRAERALHRAYDELEGVVAQRTSELARANESLRVSEERYARVIDASDEGQWDLNVGTGELFISARMKQIFGLAPEGQMSRHAEYVARAPFHPDDRERVLANFQALLAGDCERYDIEYRILPRSGETRWVRSRAKAFRDERGVTMRVSGSLTDITDRKAAEDELRRLEWQLRQAQRLEAMGTLAGGIAHDFNNILGAILGYGEMALRDTPEASRLRRDLESIMTAGERGRALVERILAFSRSSARERVAVHVERVVREALDQLAARLPSGVSIAPRLCADRAAVLGDPTQVHQVLMNLATNAVQAMAAGGTLCVRLEPVRVDAPRVATTGPVETGDYVLLEVADSGTGMPPEVMDRIFDPFFTTKEVGVGTGLGLSLVHGIVTELGGAIDVASTVGEGSAFTVYLPHAGDAADDQEREEADAPRGNGERVLIVDDEAPLVTLATETLAELGYVPAGFTSSGAALEAFRADPERFDAVITDERMPRMSGSALIRAIRGIRPAIPILLVSGYVGGAVVRRALESGADEVLKKPLSARELATSLARVLHE